MSGSLIGDEADTFSAGRMIGRYEVVRELGFGGMAAVYAVRLRSMANVEKLFAIKVLLPHLRKDEELLAMFLDEARIAVLLDHPNVAHVFELGEDQGSPYIVMEYLHGQPLSAVVKRANERERPLASDLFLHAMSEVALGLHAAHELAGPDRTPLEVVHRDVSPQNVHVAYDGRVRVVDFGIARARGRSTHTATGQIKGKFSYCSPEQITRPQEVDRRADVWALGVMLWEHLARARLFREDDEPATLWNVMNKTVPSLRSVSDVPASVERLVARCLDRDVEARPRTALEVAKALRASADERSATPDRLATEMRALFQHEILEAEAPIRTHAPEPREATVETATRRTAERTAVATGPVTLLDRTSDPDAPAPLARRSRTIPAVVFLALATSVIGLAWWQTSRDGTAPSAPLRAAAPPITREAEPAPSAAPVLEEATIDEPAETDPELVPTREHPRRRRHARAEATASTPAAPGAPAEPPHSSGTLMPSPY